MAKQAKLLEIDKRYIYTPEIQVCPYCGEPLSLQKHYQWRKVVQCWWEVAYVASRASTCQTPECEQAGKRVVSAVAQGVSVPGCTYGMDVIAQIGWWRDRDHLDRGEIHTRLSTQGIQMCAREVDYLYTSYRILLACVEKQDTWRLQQVAQERGGLVVSLDGLAPEGAAEQLWVVREVQTGSTLVAAWLEPVDHQTLQSLLSPVDALGLPVLATISDKQPCVKKALEALWPQTPHQWCHSHYLSNLAQAVYAQDRALKTAMRKTIRQEVGDSLAEVLGAVEDTSVQFVTGVALGTEPAEEPAPAEVEAGPGPTMPTATLSTPVEAGEPSGVATVCPMPSPDPPGDAGGDSPAEDADRKRQQVVKELAWDLKEVLSRRGRAPFVLSGLPMLADLLAFLHTLLACLELAEEPHLRHWSDVLSRLLPHYVDAFAEVEQAHAWVEQIGAILAGPQLLVVAHDPARPPPLKVSRLVSTQLADFLATLKAQTDLSPWLAAFRDELLAISDRYWSGLFHCYDIPGLPRTNNEMESLFGQTKRQLRRRLGIGQLCEALRRHAPGTLLASGADSPAQLQARFAQVSREDYRSQRWRHEARQQRFLHRYRWRRQRDKVLRRRLTDWSDAVSGC